MKDLRDGKVHTNNLSTTHVTADELAACVLRRGDILINRTNSRDLVGKTGIVVCDVEAVFASYLVRLRARQDCVDPWFLTYWLNSPSAQGTIKRIATPAVGQSNINPTELQKFCIVPLPPIREQQRIAEILRTWDEIIEKTKRLIEAKQQSRLGISNQLLFGMKRLAGRHTNGKSASRWFSVPADWSVPKLGEIAKECGGTNVAGEAIPVLSCTKYDGLVDSLEYFNRQVFSSDTSAYKVVRRGQFAYATNHLEEGSIGYLDFYDRGLVSPMYTVFETDKNDVHDGFLFKLFKTARYLHIFQANTSASVDRRGGLRWDEFADIRIPLPSIGEQREIDAVLNCACKEIELLKAEKIALEKQKRGLMQKLLTGEWRVPLDHPVGEAAKREAAG